MSITKIVEKDEKVDVEGDYGWSNVKEDYLCLGCRESDEGSVSTVQIVDAGTVKKYYIEARGSGALYSPIKIVKQDLTDLFKKVSPDLIILESWQTAITESSLKIADSLKIPILMISHGVSIMPYTHSFYDFLRYVSWVPYHLNLINLVSKLTAITTLNEFSESERFFDRKVANLIGVQCLKLTNHPINFARERGSLNSRKKQILVVGYFSRVKNQLAAIRAINLLPTAFRLILVGRQEGQYYQKCLKEVLHLKISHKVKFLEDVDVDLSLLMKESFLLYLPSITEVLPIVVLEAMASGTPFVSSPVGALPEINAGILKEEYSDHIVAMNKLIKNKELWNSTSRAGLLAYKKNYTKIHSKHLLKRAVDYSLQISSIKNEK
jgi:glycosyltransferase involved in cell wall biosynthesis